MAGRQMVQTDLFWGQSMTSTQFSLRLQNWIRPLHSFRRASATIFVCCATATGLASCTGLPTAGPTTSQVMDQAAAKPGRFDMVEIDSGVVSTLASQPKTRVRNWIEPAGKPPGLTIGIGDTVSVSIWQENNGQALVPRAAPPEKGGGEGGTVNIPDQMVGADGAISVPYAGRIPVAGRTPFQVQQIIEQRLEELINQPQVVVTVTKAASNFATVFLEQGAATRVVLSPAGDRLSDVIAAAGGSKLPFYDTSVRLTRYGSTTTIPMTALLSDPEEDIFAWPGDIITLEEKPDNFLVFGATTNNAQVPFDAGRLDLAQAIAKAGGLRDERADPEGVFLLRFEPPTVVRALGVPDLAKHVGGDSPVLYHLNLRQVDGYFLAAGFPVENNDLIYVANASMTELQKFFTLVGSITGPVIAGTVVTRGSGP